MPSGPVKAACAGFAALLFAWWWALSTRERLATSGDCGAGALPWADDPYSILGVTGAAEQTDVKKAYRKLALRWHPDKPNGQACTFAAIANAYDVLSDPVKKEIFDRLGQDGLDRLRDGDPSVQAGWVPPPPKEWIDRIIAAVNHLASSSRAQPTVRITATDIAGNLLTSGAALSGGVATFKITLSAQPYDRRSEALTNLEITDINHNCGPRARFLGMKRVYYLECPHIPEEGLSEEDGGDALIISVRVAAGAFLSRSMQFNAASSTFTLLMV